MNIINFSIIAHIDHGKSTLAKKFLELSNNSVLKRDGLYVDNMDLEKERGITIKSKALRIYYTHEDTNYELNMIDTPGHVDFSYEVSKALLTCDFAFLLVDATKGVQAQTVSNAYKAIENNVEIIPVINKIDMPNAQVDSVIEDLSNTFGFIKEEIMKVSAKTGDGVKDLLVELIRRSNKRNIKYFETANPRGLIFDSFYDDYVGVTLLCLVDNGTFRKNDSVVLFSNGIKFKIQELGYYGPAKVSTEKLSSHEVGYIVTGLKELADVNIGDTIYLESTSIEPFEGFTIVKPLVFLGVFPKYSDDTENLRKALEVLNLNDSSFTFRPESAGNLGYGFECGFLGLLHADIILERIKREFNIDIVVTTPSVSYIITENNGAEYTISSAREYPDPSKIKTIQEPWVKVTIVTPDEYVGSIVTIINEKRGELVDMKYTSTSQKKQVHLIYNMPLSEIIIDFNDKLKSITSGYASFDYEVIGYRNSEIVKLDIIIAQEEFSPLSNLVHKSKADYIGRNTIAKLKQELPREQFTVALQAAIGGKIIARETLQAYRKDVTAKLYGGDVTRRMKLLEKQKKGKKKMKSIGRIDVDKETFLKIIRKQ